MGQEFDKFTLEWLLNVPPPETPSRPPATGDRDSLDALVDPRLDASVRHTLQTGLEMIVIAITPLTHSGAHLMSEDNATRFWLAPGRHVSDRARDTLLRSFFHTLVFDVHKGSASLFLHPWLFAKRQRPDSSAPPFCYSVVDGDYERVDLEREAARQVDTLTAFAPDRLAFHTKSISDYQEARLKTLWTAVSKRAGDDLEGDVRKQLVEQTRATHDLICTWFDTYCGERRDFRTRLIACPITCLTVDVPRSEYELSKNVTGMAWLTLIGPVPRTDSAIKSDFDRASGLVRSLWLHLLSENLLRRGSAEFDLGQLDAVDAATHEMKHVVTALRAWVGASNELLDTRIAPRHTLDIDTKQVGVVALSADAGLEPNDLATVFLPRMFDQALAYIVAWTMSDAAVDLPFYQQDQMPASFPVLATACWSSAFESLLFAKAWKSQWNAGSIRAMKIAHTALRGLFLPAPIIVEANADAAQWLWGEWTDEPDGARRATWFARLLMHLFREAIQHGDWAQAVRLEWSDTAESARLRISNPKGDTEHQRAQVRSALASAGAIHSAALTFGDDFVSRQTASRHDGRQSMRGSAVLKFICRRLNASEPEESAPDQPVFWRQLTFRKERKEGRGHASPTDRR